MPGSASPGAPPLGAQLQRRHRAAKLARRAMGQSAPRQRAPASREKLRPNPRYFRTRSAAFGIRLSVRAIREVRCYPLGRSGAGRKQPKERKSRGAGRYGADPADPTRSGVRRATGSRSAVISPPRATIRSTRSSGSCGTRGSGTATRSRSSSTTSSSRRRGRRTRPTSSPRSTSAASSARPTRERSVKQMIGRVAGTIADWGRERGYFATDEDARRVRGRADLHPASPDGGVQLAGLVQRRLAPRGARRCSRRCFILSVEDTMESILEWNTKEGIIFRGGSGSGINLSRIRGSMEPLSRAAPPRGRSRSCAAPTRGPARSSRAAARARGEDGRARRRPSRHPRVHLVQGQGGGQGRGAARRRLRHVDRRRRLPLDPVPEREQLGARHRRVHARGRERRGLAPDRAYERRAGRRPDSRARADARDRRGGLALRRSGRPVRHDDQPVAHVPELGPDQCVEPVLRVHARRRLGLQPGVAEPDEVPPPRRDASTSSPSSTPSTSCCWRRRSSSRRRATRPSRSATTRVRSASSGSATRTSAPT